jgi:DHA1 family tetracycline resistance protein-like MFS transporter
MTTSFAIYTLNRFGYDAAQNGYLFAYIGILAIIIQGGIFERLAKVLGATTLIVTGCFLLAASLFAVPFVGPDSGGLAALLIGIAFFAVGNSIASPALTSLASKSAGDREQGKALGIMQSGASLARAIGPVIAGILLNGSWIKVGSIKNVDDHALLATFWTAAAINFAGFVIAFIFAARGKGAELDTHAA